MGMPCCYEHFQHFCPSFMRKIIFSFPAFWNYDFIVVHILILIILKISGYLFCFAIMLLSVSETAISYISCVARFTISHFPRLSLNFASVRYVICSRLNSLAISMILSLCKSEQLLFSLMHPMWLPFLLLNSIVCNASLIFLNCSLFIFVLRTFEFYF